MEMAVFWDVAPCSLVVLTSISEELTAAIIRVVHRNVVADIVVCEI
jgi:hypothetical protein